MITVKTAAGIAAIAITGVSLAACGTTVTKAPAAKTGNASGCVAGSSTNPSWCPSSPTTAAPSPSPSPAKPLTGGIGTTFEVTGPNGPSGATTVYDVKLIAVEQQATLGQYDTLTNGADHITAAEFTVTGKTGQASDDADADAVAVGSNGQDYQPSFDQITAGTNFDSGQFNVSPGTTVTGWVAFEIAPGATIASIQWSAGFDGPVATWTVK
jgi:hypothetical protein